MTTQLQTPDLPLRSPSADDLIQKQPNVCGGSACLRGRRIPVWSLVNVLRLSGSEARVREAFPDLTTVDLGAAWAYAAANSAEIDRDISENEAGQEGLVN